MYIYVCTTCGFPGDAFLSTSPGHLTLFATSSPFCPPYDFSQHSCARIVVEGHTCVSRIRYFSECMDVECIANRPVSVSSLSTDRARALGIRSVSFVSRLDRRRTDYSNIESPVTFSSLLLSCLLSLLYSVLSYCFLPFRLSPSPLHNAVLSSVYLARLHAK